MHGVERATETLAVIVPAYNESERIGEALSQVLRYLDEAGVEGQVIVVDDGSADETRALAQQVATGDARVHIVRYDTNRGKGYAVRQGVAAADADVIVFLDADLSTPVSEIDKVLAAVGEGADLVIGSRFRPGANVMQRQPLLRRAFGGGFR